MSAVDDILSRNDAGESAADIAAAVHVTVGRVYAVLRKHRPGRERKPRPCTSEVPQQVRALARIKTEPSRIAELLDVSRQYVYRILAEG